MSNLNKKKGIMIKIQTMNIIFFFIIPFFFSIYISIISCSELRSFHVTAHFTVSTKINLRVLSLHFCQIYCCYLQILGKKCLLSFERVNRSRCHDPTFWWNIIKGCNEFCSFVGQRCWSDWDSRWGGCNHQFAFMQWSGICSTA